ncbi:diiron oxygenase [Actinocorallia aurantiaca]|uniref:Diiron oxygenase n=1 Tax=Actinocorallia aurantiaca TaxID=46204 RepID=A0ABN3UNC8_9ACTN
MSATKQVTTTMVGTEPAGPRPDGRRTDYHETLKTLSEASVHRHFDAFLDIPWDDPAYAVRADDERWILPREDVLGRHPWYLALPKEEQVRIGLYRQANINKVGLQFEQVLIAGLMQHAFRLRNGDPEFRYSTHEATEECHHTQMFQEFVNRSGVDVPGAPRLFRLAFPFIPLAAAWVPAAFFIGVLAGEEPIDHLQKAVLRSGAQAHPLLQRIMQIHVAEEARHIGFAHRFLQHHVPRLNRVRRALLSLLFPLIMRWLCDVIMVPGREARRGMGIPRSVAREVWWRDPESRKTLRDFFADVRMLAESLDLMNPASRVLWRMCRIDGRPSRFRSEPASAAS